MAFDGMADFLKCLEGAGELARVAPTIDANFIPTGILQRLKRERGSGPALLCESVSGSRFPLVAGLLGSKRRICLGLEVESITEISERLSGLLTPTLPQGWFDAVRMADHFDELAALKPRPVKSAACQHTVCVGRDVDLWTLPHGRHWPQEAAPAITSGFLIAGIPGGKGTLIETCPILAVDRQRLVPCWDEFGPIARAHREAVQRQQQFPLAIVLSGDPSVILASEAPIPATIDRYLLAGFLRGQSLEVAKCRSNDLLIPAHSEFVIEGYIDYAGAWERVEHFAQDTGLVAGSCERPVILISALTHRANPVFPTRIPEPGGEARFRHWVWERLLLPVVQLTNPNVVDWSSPDYGSPGTYLFLAVKKTRPGEARQLLYALANQFPWIDSKVIVVVDSDVDCSRPEEVWTAVALNVQPDRDMNEFRGQGRRDDASRQFHDGSRLAIDATRKWAEEGQQRHWPDRMVLSEEVWRQIDEKWASFGVKRGS